MWVVRWYSRIYSCWATKAICAASPELNKIRLNRTMGETVNQVVNEWKNSMLLLDIPSWTWHLEEFLLYIWFDDEKRTASNFALYYTAD